MSIRRDRTNTSPHAVALNFIAATQAAATRPRRRNPAPLTPRPAPATLLPPSTLTPLTAHATPLPAPPAAYAALYWRAYLGTHAFAVWDILSTQQQEIAAGTRRAWAPLSTLAALTGHGDRYTLTGRKETSSRPAQVGTLTRLAAERLISWQIVGTGTRQRYIFAVNTRLPLLTPTQARQLPAAARKDHARYLDAAGIREAWQAAPAVTNVAHLFYAFLPLERPPNKYTTKINSYGYAITN